ncbi:MAG TPA: hypothetical protein VHX64_13300 [Caulobacteraceae bacterium]|jgi:hypothetical protein|nr:hypothetical protein [Caulobacteraceae bacterium]
MRFPIFRSRLAGVLAAAVLATPAFAPGFAHAQPPAPTVKILAIGTVVPGADLAKVMTILPTEMRATAQLYLEGKIDQWYSQQDRRGVVFILNVTDRKAAEAMLEALPLGQAHLMTFELTPLSPLTPLRQLLGPPAKSAP